MENMQSDASPWGKSGGKRRIGGPFAPYAALKKAGVKGGKRKSKAELLRYESEPVLVATDRTERPGRGKKDPFPSPFLPPSPRSLPLSPNSQFPESQPANRSLFETGGSETRLTQVTAELQTYKQECKRLKDLLDQVMARPEPRLAQLEAQIHTLRAENCDLKASLQRITERKAPLSPRKSAPDRKPKSPFALSSPKLKPKAVPKSPSLPLSKTPHKGTDTSERKWTLEDLQVREEEVWPLLRHLAYRLQLQALDRDQLAGLLGEGGKGLEKTLQSLPFRFKLQEARTISRYLRQIASEQRSKDIVRILTEILPIWPVFSASSAQILNEELHSSFQPHCQALRDLCQAFDSQGRGWVRPDHFCKALEKVGISLREEAIRYLELLCYSQSKELDQVPYEALLSDYVSEDSAAVSLLSAILSHVAGYLKSSELRPKDLFACENGKISPESLVRGLQQVPGLVVGELEATAVLEALQAPETDELCIEMRQMEQIMQSLGVEMHKKSKFQQTQWLLHQSQASLPYVKQVSFLQEEEK